jgi:hypothetical protein
MLDANGGKIEWRFIEQFHNLKEKEVSGQVIKKRISHFVPQNKDENCFGRSADVIAFCDKTLNLPEFKGSEATVAFTRS